MSAVCSLVATFVVPGVGGLIVEVLGNIIELCQELEENEEMCSAVYKRLQFVSEELAKISDEEAMRQNQVLFILLNLVHIQEMTKWRKEWDEDRRKQEQMLLAIAANQQRIHADLQNKDNNLVESLAMLKFEMTHKKEQNSMATLAMMKRTFNKVTRTSGAKVPAVPEWFISSDDVEFDTKDQFDCGSYGAVTRGTWLKGTKVVIKSLLMDDEQAKASFFKEVEDAIHGNFADHFTEDKSNIWRLFYEAAVGLDYIHSQKVVHGDLKCNNIVIGADDHAKICDFGFSYIRSQSVGLSKKAQTDTVRWKAPECLMPMGEVADETNNPRFASDIYSFGMCIIEAFSGEPPFALDDDDTILEKVFSGEEYPRPEGIADDEWALVKRLTDPEWQQRISLSTAISELKMFADRENERNNIDKTDRECPGCSSM
ncbi:Serine/threonine protein Kinase, partial [Phytophthora palmivora]